MTPLDQMLLAIDRLRGPSRRMRIVLCCALAAVPVSILVMAGLLIWRFA